MLCLGALLFELGPHSFLQLDEKTKAFVVEGVDALEQLGQSLVLLPRIRVHPLRLLRLLLLLLHAHVQINQNSNDGRKELFKSSRVGVDFFGEEDDMLVYFSDEDRVHHEHYEVHQPARVNVIDIEK